MKNPKYEEFLDDMSQKLFGRSRNNRICVTCGSSKIEYDDFRDDLSRKEYKISKMCQKCQDGVFGI